MLWRSNFQGQVPLPLSRNPLSDPFSFFPVPSRGSPPDPLPYRPGFFFSWLNTQTLCCHSFFRCFFFLSDSSPHTLRFRERPPKPAAAGPRYPPPLISDFFFLPKKDFETPAFSQEDPCVGPILCPFALVYADLPRDFRKFETHLPWYLPSLTLSLQNFSR